MADFRIQPSDIITPTSVTLIRRDPLANLPPGLSAKKRIQGFIEAVALVASTLRDPDKFRPDATTSQRQVRSAVFTMNPVPRGNTVTDHSIRRPIIVQFTGVITETPFIQYTASDFGLAPTVSRVQDQLRLIEQFYEEREPLYMASSLGAIDGMGIRTLSTGKGQETGAAVDITITLQQIMFIDAIRDEPIPDSQSAQLGIEPIQSATSSAS